MAKISSLRVEEEKMSFSLPMILSQNFPGSQEYRERKNFPDYEQEEPGSAVESAQTQHTKRPQPSWCGKVLQPKLLPQF